jgi:hypothetical protein
MINHQSFNKVQKSKESLPSVPDPVQAVSEAPETENSAERQKGVLRQLQEGHFTGVADVRLRINFHDEISAMENEQLKSVADGETNKFINTITDFLNPQEQKDEDLAPIIDAFIVDAKNVDAFIADAENAKADFLGKENPSIDSLLDDLEAAFKKLLAGLDGLIQETVAEAPAPVLAEEIVETVIDSANEGEPVVSVLAEETPVVELPVEELPEAPVPEEPIAMDEPVVVEPPVEAEDNAAAQIAQLIEDLTSLFDTAVGELKDTLSNTSALPELSEPNGNGVAFEKFLNIYNDLYGIGTAVGQTSSFEIEA